MLTSEQKEVLTFLVKILRDNAIEFQAGGGLAAIAYGATRPLYDIDLEIYKKDVDTVRELLKEYIIEDWNNDTGGPDDEFDLWMMTLKIKEVSVDINQVEGSRVRSKGGGWVAQPEVMRAEMKIVEGIEVPAQNKDELIAYKKILARETDLEDVQQIF